MNKKDYIREFEFESKRCQSYFNLMYKIFQFTFAFVVALLAIAFKDYDKNNQYTNLILQYILPSGLYVFGIMYAYNAYALAICGKRAEIIHGKIYARIDDPQGGNTEIINTMRRYVIANRKITLLSYGVPLGFYMVMPITSCIIGDKYIHFFQNQKMDIVPYILFVIYFILLMIVVINISKDHFTIDKLQQKY